MRRVDPDFGPGVRDRFAFAATVAADAVAEAEAGRRAVAARLDAMLGPDTVLCLPTAPGIAPLKYSTPERVDRLLFDRPARRRRSQVIENRGYES